MWEQLPTFITIVVFKDEPDVEYIYFAHQEIRQFGYRLTEEVKKKELQNQN